MKTRNLIMAACAVSALAASCEKTGGGNDTGTTSGEKPKILATIDMSPKASNVRRPTDTLYRSMT